MDINIKVFSWCMKLVVCNISIKYYYDKGGGRL